MKTSAPLILLTGASGHLGFRTLIVALETGFRVRAAIRSQSKVDAILATPSIKRLAPGRKLSFAIVSDITVDDAYKEALKDVTYVVHIASPLPKGPVADFDAELIQPALKGTLGILTSAKKVLTVKRVVITSSVAAVVPTEKTLRAGTDEVFTANGSLPNPESPRSDVRLAYAASKILALNASTDFIKWEEPHFDIINVMPSFLVGRNELNTKAIDVLSSTNAMAIAQVLGHASKNPILGSSVHVDDAARVHVLALDSKVKGNQNFGAASDWSGNFQWGDAIEIVKRHFPEAVKDGRLPVTAKALTRKFRFDASKTEEVLGIKFQNYEAQVVSVIEHYLELLAKGSKTTEV